MVLVSVSVISASFGIIVLNSVCSLALFVWSELVLAISFFPNFIVAVLVGYNYHTFLRCVAVFCGGGSEVRDIQGVCFKMPGCFAIFRTSVSVLDRLLSFSSLCLEHHWAFWTERLGLGMVVWTEFCCFALQSAFEWLAGLRVVPSVFLWLVLKRLLYTPAPSVFLWLVLKWLLYTPVPSVFHRLVWEQSL